MPQYPLRLPAIRVQQPLGEFYAISLSAYVLRSVIFLDPTRILSIDRSRLLYSLIGNQREASFRRAKQIAQYIDGVESAFPNSIIIAANYINYGEQQLEEKKRWTVQATGGGYELVIPTGEQMATVVDGQHRLLGFDYCRPYRKEMELLCSVYMDLPQAYQAYLFATININQRKVDKSLAYEQFGYNLDEEDRQGWAPDKCAVYLARKLNIDERSPLHNHVRVAPLDPEGVLSSKRGEDWTVSTACIVEGVVSLISSNAKSDRDALHKFDSVHRRRSVLGMDRSPLRSLYLECSDDAFYGLVRDYLDICHQMLWQWAGERSYIIKTIGIQAQFDVLRAIAQETKDIPTILQTARRVLEASSRIDFSDPFFQASGGGRVHVKNVLLLRGKLAPLESLPAADIAAYAEFAAR